MPKGIVTVVQFYSLYRSIRCLGCRKTLPAQGNCSQCWMRTRARCRKGEGRNGGLLQVS
jgi:hypothetical protein